MNGTCRVVEELLSLPVDSVAEMHSINRLLWKELTQFSSICFTDNRGHQHLLEETHMMMLKKRIRKTGLIQNPLKQIGLFFQTISLELQLDLKVKTVFFLLLTHLQSLFKLSWHKKIPNQNCHSQTQEIRFNVLWFLALVWYFLEHNVLKGILLPKEEFTLISSKSSWPSALPAGSRQACTQWPGRWWGCTWLLTLQAVLGSLRTGWGPSPAVRRLTRPRPRRKGSRQWGTLRRSALPPCESRKETAGFVQSSQTLAEQHRARQSARELHSTERKRKMVTRLFYLFISCLCFFCLTQSS